MHHGHYHDLGYSAILHGAVNGKVQHQVGLTHHFGWADLYGTGAVVNDLTPNVGDPNSFTPEYKAFLVDIEKA